MCTDWLAKDKDKKYVDPFLLNAFQYHNTSECYNTFLN